MAPRIPGLGESMTEQHQRAAALLRDMDADAIGFDRAVRWLAHVDSLSGLRRRENRSVSGLRMILHRCELGFHFSAEIGLRFGRIDALTALAQGNCRLGPVEGIAQRARLRQRVAEKRFAKVGKIAIVRTTKRIAVCSSS